MSWIYFTDRDLGKVPLIIMVGQTPTAELARTFVHSLQRVEAFLAAHSSPFIAKVYRPAPGELATAATAPGRIELWYPKR
ncbi:MAG: hypothetical protein Q8L49_05845 [Burkholderiaceae bacterium]|nr:hypothetical protein [Burkholderiaceae bacterium]